MFKYVVHILNFLSRSYRNGYPDEGMAGAASAETRIWQPMGLPECIYEPNLSLFVFCGRFEGLRENSTTTRLPWSTQRSLSCSSELGQPLYFDRRVTYVFNVPISLAVTVLTFQQRRVSLVLWMRPRRRLAISRWTRTKRYCGHIY